MEDPVDIILRLVGGKAFIAQTTASADAVRELGAASREANVASAEGAAASSRSAGAMGMVRRAGRGGALALAAMAAEGAHLAINFDKQMEMIHTQAGASQSAVHGLSKEILNMAKSGQYAQTPEELAKGLYHLVSVGMKPAQALDALKVAAQGAAVGAANLEDTTTALGAAWLVNIKGAGSFRHVMALANATIGAGNMRMEDLVQAMGTGILPSAKQAGLGIKDVFGALAILKDEGMQGSSAMAQLATALHFLYNPTTKASAALKQVGLSGEQLYKTMSTKGLPEALKLLHDRLQRIHDPAKRVQLLGDILPGGRGRVLVTLMNQWDRYEKKIHQIEGTTGKFGDAVAKTHQTAAFKMHAAWSQVQANLIDLGHALEPVAVVLAQTLAKVVGVVGAIVKAFNKLPGAWKAVVGALAGVGIGAMAGGPAGALIAGLIMGAVLLIKYWKPISHFFSGIGKAISGAFRDAAHWVTTAIHNIGHVLGLSGKDWQNIGHVISNVWHMVTSVIGKAVGIIKTAWGVMVAAFKVAWAVVVPVVKAAIGPIIGIVKSLVSGIGAVVKIVVGVLTGHFGRAWSGVKQLFKGSVHFVINVLRLMISPFKAIIGNLGNILTKIWGFVKRLAGALINNLKHAFDILIQPIRVAIGVIKGLINPIKSVISGIGKAAGGIFDFVKSTLGLNDAKDRVLSLRHAMDMLNTAVKNVASSALDAANRLAHVPNKPGKGAGGVGGGVPTWASGGTQLWSGPAVVGEEGPELLWLPGGTTIQPLSKPSSAATSSPSTRLDFALGARLKHTTIIQVNKREIARATSSFVDDKMEQA